MGGDMVLSDGSRLRVRGNVKPKRKTGDILKHGGARGQDKLDEVLLVLVDTSFSMTESMGMTSKMLAAWNALQKHIAPNMMGWAYGVITFQGFGEVDWKVYPCKDTNALTTTMHPIPMGGTPIGAALKFAWDWLRSNAKQARIILISDGCPTDMEDDEILGMALERKSIPIDTVGVGARGNVEYNPEFLRRLSELTGGVFCEVSTVRTLLDTILQLSPAQRPLLGPAREDE